MCDSIDCSFINFNLYFAGSEMKILHYLLGVPPIRSGGLVKYALDLAAAEQKIGDEIVLLFPGKNSFLQRRLEIRKSKALKWANAYEIHNTLPIPEKGIKDVKPFIQDDSSEEDESVYKDFLLLIKPDIIHVHSLMGISKKFFLMAKELGITIIYTTHDYFGICPKINLLYEQHVCLNQSGDNCSICCRNIKDTEKLDTILYKAYMKLISIEMFRNIMQKEKIVEMVSKLKKQLERKSRKCDNSVIEQNNSDYRLLKKYYLEIFQNIDIYHFNSRQAEDIFRKNIEIKCGRVIDIAHKDIKDERHKKNFGNILRISYLGTLQQIKGFYLLKEVLDELYLERKEFILNVYFSSRQENDEYIRYHAPYSYNKLEDVMDETDLLVVPSICMETFGFVVKEAISYGVPCLITENVGAKDWVRKYNGISIVVEPTKEALLYSLIQIYDNRSILEDINKKILNMEYDFSFTNHVNEIRNLYTKADTGV